MITEEQLEKLARKYQTSLFPNTIREYSQHIFLEYLYQEPEGDKMLFKGGTALRIVYGSSRFSEDLDFSLAGVSSTQAKPFVEEIFIRVLTNLERLGVKVTLGTKSGATTGGYFGIASIEIVGFRPVEISINVSSRQKEKIKGEVENIASDFTSTYTLVHLPQEMIVAEKIFGALRERKKPRDFYDLYFMMRKNMLSSSQKMRLARIKQEIMTDAKNVDFRRELGAFLPANQQAIIRDFAKTLERELRRQLG